jgi:hypothetical protein
LTALLAPNSTFHRLSLRSRAQNRSARHPYALGSHTLALLTPLIAQSLSTNCLPSENLSPHELSRLGLYPAYQLYKNNTYGRLMNRFGLQKVYILLAGWGLIRADFLTPYYDITYSQSAEGYKRRRKADRYHDFRMLPDEIHEEIVLFGGKDYLRLFCSLTGATKVKKTVFYNSARAPQVTGCVLKPFNTTTRINWHYECAKAFLDGTINPLLIVDIRFCPV